MVRKVLHLGRDEVSSVGKINAEGRKGRAVRMMGWGRMYMERVGGRGGHKKRTDRSPLSVRFLGRGSALATDFLEDLGSDQLHVVP